MTSVSCDEILQTSSYSKKTLDTIVEVEKLLKINSNEEALGKLLYAVKSNDNNEFEKASFLYLIGLAYHNLKSFSKANKNFIAVLNNKATPVPMYLQAIKGLENKYLSDDQIELILLRLSEITKKHLDVNLKVAKAEFVYELSKFNTTIQILDSVLTSKTSLSNDQLEKINGLRFNSYLNLSELDRALEIIQTILIIKPNKNNFKRLAYTYALLNERDKHFNIWETINDTFDLDLNETKYFYELLKTRRFQVKADEVFAVGKKKGFY